jgi:cell division protease FtsH
MVTRYGMSEKLGPRTFGKREELVFLGREISEQRNYSDKIAETIDEEIKGLIDNAYKTARKVVTTNKDRLSQIARYLVSNETIEGDDFIDLFNSPPPGFDPAPAG